LDFDWPESGGSTNKNVATGCEEDRVRAIVDNPSFASTYTGNRIRGKCHLKTNSRQSFCDHGLIIVSEKARPCELPIANPRLLIEMVGGD
jgi:hypothetical protein